MKWKDLAEHLKCDLLEEGESLISKFPELSIWNWGSGSGGEIIGGIKFSYSTGTIYIGDFEYEYSKYYKAPESIGLKRVLTFCLIDDSGLSLPEMYLRSEPPIHKLVNRAVGKNDIYFDEDQEFSNNFEILGDKEKITKIMEPGVRSYLLRYFENSRLKIETHNNMLLLHHGTMVKPKDTRAFVFTAVEMANMWRETNIDFEVPASF
jgi:hypothetical protein